MQSPSGELIINPFAPSTAFPFSDIGDTTKIIGVRQSMIDQPLNLAADHLKTMHTSTGASYLILNGGNGTITNNAFGAENDFTPLITVTGTVGNMIFALPLVDLDDPQNPVQGVLANKNIFNSMTHRFEVPAVAHADLTTSSDPQAMVGAGPLPVQPSTPISGAGGGLINPANDEAVGIDTPRSHRCWRCGVRGVG